jgi:Ser/Thr protein kinase RdoA (MazF antagonist)
MFMDSSATVIKKILTTTPPAFADAGAAKIALDLYGIDGVVQPLVSERDQNFKLRCRDGERYVLKISNHAEPFEVIDFQIRALLHVATRDPSIPLPRVIPTLAGSLHGRIEHDGQLHFVRLLSWLDGRVMHATAAGPVLARDMGRFLARLGVALQGFDHPGSNLPLLWDMKRAASLADFVGCIEEAGLRRMVEETLDTFVSRVKPVLDGLRTQVIHNDMNPGNLLIDRERPDQISGLIDFGDLTKSPLIIDLAVAAAYQLSPGEDPLAGVLPMISGYHGVEPLQPVEMELLTDLIRTRLITSLLIGSYRARLFPENREYLLISHQSAKNFLQNLKHLPAGAALERIHAACLNAHLNDHLNTWVETP